MTAYIAVVVRQCDLYLRVNNETVYFPNSGGELIIRCDINSI